MRRERLSNLWRAWRMPLVGGAVGTLVALFALDPAFIAGTGGKWLRPENDYNAYLVAWNYFMVDEWRFPLFAIPAMGYPEGGSILLNDALPLVALPTKLLYDISGLRVNPFGWWIFLTYVLQGLMAARLVRAVGGRSLIAAAAGAVLAVCTTPFLHRMAHTALSSHFLILWALSLHFESTRGPSRRIVELWVLAGVALLVNPYLFAMVMCLHVTTVATLLWRRRLTRGDLTTAAVGCAAVIAVAVASGYGFMFTNPSSMRSSGFGLYSWNLVGLLFPPALGLPRNATGGQYEGEAWMGPGALAIVIVALALHGRRLLPTIRRQWLFCAALFLFVAYAASNRVYFGNTLVLAYPLPAALEGAANYFRANGRFIWPVAYVLMVVPVALLFRWSRREVALAVAAAGVLLQVWDVRPTMAYLQASTETPQPELIETARVDAWLRGHDRVYQFPSWTCGGLGGSARSWGNVESNRELQVELLAARLGKPSNSVYTARALKDCASEFAWAQQPQLEPGVLYLLGHEAVAGSPRLTELARSPNCIDLSWSTVCSRRFAGPAAVTPVDGAGSSPE